VREAGDEVERIGIGAHAQQRRGGRLLRGLRLLAPVRDEDARVLALCQGAPASPCSTSPTSPAVLSPADLTGRALNDADTAILKRSTRRVRRSCVTSLRSRRGAAAGSDDGVRFARAPSPGARKALEALKSARASALSAMPRRSSRSTPRPPPRPGHAHRRSRDRGGARAVFREFCIGK